MSQKKVTIQSTNPFCPEIKVPISLMPAILEYRKQFGGGSNNNMLATITLFASLYNALGKSGWLKLLKISQAKPKPRRATK